MFDCDGPFGADLVEMRSGEFRNELAKLFSLLIERPVVPNDAQPYK